MFYKKKRIGNRMYTVVDQDELEKVPDTEGLAVEVTVDGREYVLPYKESNKGALPGYYNTDTILPRVVLPDESDYPEYSTEGMTDYSKPETLQEMLDERAKYLKEEREIMANPENISVFPVNEDDTPMLAGLKKVINEKHIDFDLYQDHFGQTNFANIKRNLTSDKKHDITMKMLSRITDAIGVNVSLTFEDMHKDEPNPIGRSISIDLSTGKERGDGDESF